MSQLGRISGPLLKNNILRDGIDLAFETDLLYLNVNAGTIGIRSDTNSTKELFVRQSAKTTNLIVDTRSDIANFAVTTNQIQNAISSITIRPNQTLDPQVTAPQINTADLEFNNNQILNHTADSDIDLLPIGTGKVIVNGGVTVNGNVHATGNITFDGDIQLGDNNDDNVVFSADINSNIVPNNPLNVPVYNLGTLSKQWATSYFNNIDSFLQLPNIKFQGNTISSTVTDSDIIFNSNGTGGVTLDTRLKITDNNISNVWENATTDLQKSIQLTPNGVSNLLLNATTALKLPVGNNSNRVMGQTGEMRYNSTSNLVEAWQPNGYVNMLNFYSTDRQAYITPELTPGTNDNILRFATTGTIKATISSTALKANSFQAGNIALVGDAFSNTNTSTDTFISPTSGITLINSIPIQDNTITNVTDGPITIRGTGVNGYVKFVGTNAIRIPIGNTSERRLTPELAETRWNTDLGYLEIFDGTQWISSVGQQGAASLADVEDIMDVWAIILG